MPTVKLTYYKPKGKYYSEGEFETLRESWHDVVDDVRMMQLAGQLPGLARGCREFVVLMQPGEPWGVSHVFMPVGGEEPPKPEPSNSAIHIRAYEKKLGHLLVAVRALIAELLDEHIAAGELQRIVRSVRRSIWEQDPEALSPGGAYGQLVAELVAKLQTEVNSKEKYPDDL